MLFYFLFIFYYLLINPRKHHKKASPDGKVL